MRRVLPVRGDRYITERDGPVGLEQFYRPTILFFAAFASSIPADSFSRVVDRIDEIAFEPVDMRFEFLDSH